MKKHEFLLLSAISLMLGGCHKDDIQMSSASGTIRLYDTNTPSIDIPLHGLVVYLFDADYHRPDTSFIENSRSGIIDSVQTDEQGYYGFSNLLPGNYAVTPNPFTSENYRFQLADNTSSSGFKVDSDSKEYIINFVSPTPSAENGNEIKIKLKFLNFPVNNQFNFIVSRKAWTFFNLSDYYYEIWSSHEFVIPSNEVEFIFYADLGWGNFFETRENYLRMKMIRYDCRFFGCDLYKAYTDLALPLTNPPLDNVWQINHADYVFEK